MDIKFLPVSHWDAGKCIGWRVRHQTLPLPVLNTALQYGWWCSLIVTWSLMPSPSSSASPLISTNKGYGIKDYIRAIATAVRRTLSFKAHKNIMQAVLNHGFTCSLNGALLRQFSESRT